MFAASYFSDWFFAGTYWPKVGGELERGCVHATDAAIWQALSTDVAIWAVTGSDEGC